MVCCFAPRCSHNNDRDWCKFYRFPKEKRLFDNWVYLIRRADKLPTKHSVVCSCHFLDGIKDNGPTIFQTETNSSRESRKKVFPLNMNLSPRENELSTEPANTDLENVNLQKEVMPNFCGVFGCSEKAVRESRVNFFRLPSQTGHNKKVCKLKELRRAKWVRALSRLGQCKTALKNLRVCSNHFISGRPADLYDVDDPDWVPSVNISKTAPVRDDPELETVRLLSKKCSMWYCKNTGDKTWGSEVTYEKFPSDLVTREMWVMLCRRKGTWDTRCSFVCSDHFLPTDWLADGSLRPGSLPIKRPHIPGQPLLGQVEDGGGRRCCVPGCPTADRSKGKLLVPFPASEEARHHWARNIFRGPYRDILPSDSSLVCQDHFSEQDWSINKGTKVLKRTAVPNVFNHSRKRVDGNSAQRDHSYIETPEVKEGLCKEAVDRLMVEVERDSKGSDETDEEMELEMEAFSDGELEQLERERRAELEDLRRRNLDLVRHNNELLQRLTNKSLSARRIRRKLVGLVAVRLRRVLNADQLLRLYGKGTTWSTRTLGLASYLRQRLSDPGYTEFRKHTPLPTLTLLNKLDNNWNLIKI